MSEKLTNTCSESEYSNPLSPGEILCRARKERGLAAEEIMIHLGITHRTFNALEHDDYDHLPSPLYVKGYIRRYCSILGISDTEALSRFDARANELGLANKKESLTYLDRKVGNRTDGSKGKGWIRIMPITVVMVMAVIAWMIFWDHGLVFLPTQIDDNPELLSNVTDLPSADNKGLVNTNESELQPRLEIKSLAPYQEGATENSFETVTESARESSTEGSINLTQQQAEDKPEASQIADNPMSKVSIAADENVLQIKVTQRSWIEVLDAKGDILLADLKTAGYKGEVEGMAPFDVNLGYAPGVELTLNGKRVGIPTTGNDNTAKLKIGDEEKR